MGLAYAKIKPQRESIIEKSNLESHEEKEITSENSLLFVNTLNLIKDSKKNIWMYSPISDSFYLYYIKDKDEYTLDLYPTSKCTICPECKLGLRLYDAPNGSANVIKKYSQNEKIQATSDFIVDKSGDIYVYVVEMDDTMQPSSIIDGWVIYKNKRNNFVNIKYNSTTQTVMQDGVIDVDKISNLYAELLLTDDINRVYGKNYLQFFSSATGGKKFATVSKGTVDEYTISKGNRSIYEDKYKENGKLKTKFFNPSMTAIQRNGPTVAKNAYGFPKVDEKFSNSKAYKENKEKKGHNPYVYDYSMDYEADGIFADPKLTSDESLKKDMTQLYKDINFDIRSEHALYEKMFNRYNRFKLPYPDDMLSHAFPHIFFTRPDCNVINTDGSALVKKVKANANFDYAFSHRKSLVTNLSMNGKSQDFNLFLSNKAEEFSLTDESIATATTGLTYRKNQIVYGKTNDESKANGEFSVKYTDNRNLDVFHFHKLWTDYISNVYSGLWYPKSKYLWMKTIDYACSVYYILTAEDGETILFWSKYYGVFPTNVPSSSYSWSKGNTLTSPEVSITYQYTMKEDFNPISIVEFNINSRLDEMSMIKYAPVFNPNLGGSGYTWVGRPFIETVVDGDDYYFKLRFKDPN